MDLNKCFSRKVCMKVLRVVNSFVLVSMMIRLFFLQLYIFMSVNDHDQLS